MIRFFVLRIVLPLVLLLVLRSVIVYLWRAFAGSGSVQKQAAGGVKPGGELKRDPVCGTYVSLASAVTKTVDGQVLHFCSPSCRDKFRAG